ncbi:major capsid protein [Psittacid alphaherpesvirus 5]|nr:major capsid protein [Psittacid alphaherpesvirus 5]
MLREEPFRAVISAPFVKAGELLGALRESCHATFYNWITKEVSDNDESYRHQFDVLLGSYVNTVTLTRFLETSLSVACICVRFPELRYADVGVIQFVTTNPMMATSDTEIPARPTHTYITKRWNKSNLTASLNISATARGLISGETLDGTELSDFARVRAINQLARNVKTTLDSFERGTIHHVITILIAKSPPSPLLCPLADFFLTNRHLTRVVQGALLSAMKRSVIRDLFFLDKQRFRGSKADLINKIGEMIRCTMPSVADVRISHRTVDGKTIEGILLTTSPVRDVILSVLGSAGAEAVVPAAYSEMVISGPNLVTALLTGRAVRNFEEAATRLLDFKEGDFLTDENIPSSNNDGPAEMVVPAQLIDIGGDIVFLESLEKIYNRTRVSYPLVRPVDLTFGFPLGLWKPISERYSASVSDLSPPQNTFNVREHPPREMWFFNKEGNMISVKFEDALSTIAHPIAHGITDILNDLLQVPWLQAREPAPLGFTVHRFQTALPRVLMIRFLEALLAYPQPYSEALLINTKTPEQFYQHTNPFLTLEIHPFFDVFRSIRDIPIPHDDPLFLPNEPVTLDASPRIINGNIPLPLCSADFRTHRGFQISQGRYRLSPQTILSIETTFNDANYPLALYIIEAAIHGSEPIFMESQRFVAQCVNSYWHSTRGIAFLTSFPMIMYIYHNLGGLIEHDCHMIYADICMQLQALRSVITQFTQPGMRLLGHSVEDLNNILADVAVFPPMIYDCDPILRARAVRVTRRVEIFTFGEREVNILLRDPVAPIEFNVASPNLYHGQQYTQNARIESGEHHDGEWTVLSKIFYYALLPAMARGRCCSMGVEYEMIYALLNTTRLPTTPEELSDGSRLTDAHHPLHPNNLLPETFNTLLSNGRLRSIDNEGLIAFINSTQRRQAHGTVPLRVQYLPDPAFMNLNFPRTVLMDGVLYNGIIMINYNTYDATANPNNYFYALPVHNFFSRRNIVDACFRTNVNMGQLSEDLPLVPTFLGAEMYRTIRLPSCLYAANAGREVSIPTLAYSLVASYFKLSPVSLLNQIRSGLHPGFALTCVRQDRFLADHIMFTRRASESYYFGVPTMTHRKEAGGIAIDTSQPRAHIDMGLGFSSTRLPATLNCTLTDMGARCQNLFNARFPGQFTHAEIADYVNEQLIANDKTVLDMNNATILTYDRPPLPPGVGLGQLSSLEFIITPVTADLKYFLTPFSPRGRGNLAVLEQDCCNEEQKLNELSDRVMYDHSVADSANPSRATVNPWASQKFSLGDRLYNAERGFIVSTEYYSPCAKFFSPNRIVERGKCLLKIIRDAASTLETTTGDTEYQFIAPPGSDELITDPCALLQEVYPILCASDPALFASFDVKNATRRSMTRENHYAQYLIYDNSPIAGAVLKDVSLSTTM